MFESAVAESETEEAESARSDEKDFSDAELGPDGKPRTYILTGTIPEKTPSILDGITDLGSAMQLAAELESNLKMRRRESIEAQKALDEARMALDASTRQVGQLSAQLAIAREELSDTARDLAVARFHLTQQAALPPATALVDPSAVAKKAVVEARVVAKMVFAVAVNSVTTLLQSIGALLAKPLDAAGSILKRVLGELELAKDAAFRSAARRTAARTGIQTVPAFVVSAGALAPAKTIKYGEKAKYVWRDPVAA